MRGASDSALKGRLTGGEAAANVLAYRAVPATSRKRAGAQHRGKITSEKENGQPKPPNKTHAGWVFTSPELASYAMHAALKSSLKRTNGEQTRTPCNRFVLGSARILCPSNFRKTCPAKNSHRKHDARTTGSNDR
jgi:hypothetical protein